MASLPNLAGAAAGRSPLLRAGVGRHGGLHDDRLRDAERAAPDGAEAALGRGDGGQ